MKLSRKAGATAFCLSVLCLFISQVSGNRAQLGRGRSIELPSQVMLDERSKPFFSSGGKIGFVTSVTSGSLISFSATSAKVLTSVTVGETAGVASMAQIGKRRLIAVPAANDPDSGHPASVSIIDATNVWKLELVSLIMLPAEARITPSTRALLTSDGRYSLIASSFDEPELFSFSVDTGQTISRLRLAGRPSEIALRDDGLIAMPSSGASTISFFRPDENG